MFEMVSFHTEAGLKPLPPLIDDPPSMIVCLQSDHTATRCCFISLMSHIYIYIYVYIYIYIMVRWPDNIMDLMLLRQSCIGLPRTSGN